MISRAIRAIRLYLTGPVSAEEEAEEEKAAQLKRDNAVMWDDGQLGWMRDEITRARLNRISRRAGLPRA
jgi:hypothetical protein